MKAVEVALPVFQMKLEMSFYTYNTNQFIRLPFSNQKGFSIPAVS